MKNDDSKKSQGSKVEDEKENEREEMQEVFDTEFVKKELAKQKDKLPDDVYRKSKSILDIGTLTEKRLVRKLLNGEITPQRFRLLYQLLHYPEGADQGKNKLKKELAEQHIIDPRITNEIFELALSAINRGMPKTDDYYGDIELVKELVEASILGKDRSTTFRKKIKNKRELKKTAVELQEKGDADRRDEVLPGEEVAKYSRQYETTISRAEQVMLLATPANVRETIEYRRLRDTLAESRKGSVGDYNKLGDLFGLMAHGDKKTVPKIEDAVYGLFPEVVRKNEKPVTKADLKTRLLDLEKETGLDLQVEFYLDRLFERLSGFQKLRREVVEYETRISEIFRAGEYRVAQRALEETSCENTGNWVGFPVRKGQKVTYVKKTKDYDTGKVKEELAEGEIINVELSKPVILDESGEVSGERGIGTVLITVSGLGTLPEGEFRKLVDATDMCPVVESIKELEEITGIAEMEISLRAGTELAYDESTGRNKHGEAAAKEKVVKIKRIDDKEVELDREVATLHREEAPRLAVSGELDEDRKGKVLTLGQFAKWIRRREAVPNPKTPEELQKMTDALERARNRKYTTRNQNHYMAPQWVPGSCLFTDVPSGNVVPPRANRVRVNAVKEGENGVEVVLNKRAITGASALRTARKHELQNLDPDTEAERQTDFIDDEEEQKHERRRVKKQIEDDLIKQQEEEEKEGETVIPNVGKIIDWADQQNVPGAVLSGEKVIGQAKAPTYSYFKELWKQTNFLSLQDIWEFGKAAYEYHVRRWGRNIKNNFSNIGRHFPYIGTEMDRIKQAAETEEMNQFKEAMENWGIWQIEDTLYGSVTRDQVKACLIVLSSKGQMRWEDIRLWQSLNRYVDSAHFIPIPVNGDFTAQDKYGKTGLDYIGPAIDFLWGEGTYSEWFNQNNNAFNQNKKSWHHKGDQLEGDPKNVGGVTAELGRLLQRHKMGYYVDPQEYEGLVDFCIHKGKSSAEAKIYYLVEGCAAKNSRGQSILPWDRIGNLDGEFLNRLPMLDYLTDKYTKKPFQESVRPWKRADFEKLVEYWDEGSGRVPTSVAKDGTPPPKAREFLWAEVLRHPWVLSRNNKGLRNADQIDHDDAHVIVPLASETLVQNICGSHVGTKKYFTEEAITNAYPGYNRYIRTLAEHKDVPKLLSCIRSFARFDSIVGDRYLKDKEDSYTRVSKPNYYRRPVVDTLYAVDHKDQLHGMLRNIAKAYEWDISIMFEETHHVKTNKEQAQKQKQIEDFISNFGRELEKRVLVDGGKKMVQAVLDSKLTGLYYDLPGGEKEVEQRRAKYDAEAQVYGIFAGKM